MPSRTRARVGSHPCDSRLERRSRVRVSRCGNSGRPRNRSRTTLTQILDPTTALRPLSKSPPRLALPYSCLHSLKLASPYGHCVSPNRISPNPVSTATLLLARSTRHPRSPSSRFRFPYGFTHTLVIPFVLLVVLQSSFPPLALFSRNPANLIRFAFALDSWVLRSRCAQLPVLTLRPLASSSQAGGQAVRAGVCSSRSTSSLVSLLSRLLAR